MMVTDLADLARTQTPVRLVDVRTPGEYETVHISGTSSVPLDTLAEDAREIRENLEASIVLKCQSGQRPGKAGEALRAAGQDSLHVLRGGVNAWVAAGFPVVRGPRKLSLERQVRIVAGALAAVGGLLGAVVNPLFGLLPAFVGSGLVFAALTDSCAMAMMLAKLPCNRPATCDVGAMVRALSGENTPPGVGGSPVSLAG
jgi:rhodanese-related sulfurtransferase